jgi:hypothetical protein
MDSRIENPKGISNHPPWQSSTPMHQQPQLECQEMTPIGQHFSQRTNRWNEFAYNVAPTMAETQPLICIQTSIGCVS